MKTNKEKYNEKKSCWNCKHSVNHRYHGFAGTYWEPPEPAYVEDCTGKNVEENTWDQAEKTSHETGQDVEQILPSICNSYEPEIVKCPICKKDYEAWQGESDIEFGGHCDNSDCEEKFIQMIKEQYDY